MTNQSYPSCFHILNKTNFWITCFSESVCLLISYPPTYLPAYLPIITATDNGEMTLKTNTQTNFIKPTANIHLLFIDKVVIDHTHQCTFVSKWGTDNHAGII